MKRTHVKDTDKDRQTGERQKGILKLIMVLEKIDEKDTCDRQTERGEKEKDRLKIIMALEKKDKKTYVTDSYKNRQTGERQKDRQS